MAVAGLGGRGSGGPVPAIYKLLLGKIVNFKIGIISLANIGILIIF